MKKHQHAVEEGSRLCKQHVLRHVWLVKAGASLLAPMLLFYTPPEAQTGAYGSKCDKEACMGAGIGTLLGDWPRMLQVASLSPHLFWNRMLICGTLQTKLLLKSSPFILTFKALHQVTQGCPSFLMKAGVDLTSALLSACGDPLSAAVMQRPATAGLFCRLQNHQSFSKRRKFHWLGYSNASALP